MKDYYRMSSEDALQNVKSTLQGISNQEAQKRIEQYGKNVLEEAKKDSILKIFLSQFKDLLVLILIAAAIISMISGEVSSTLVILFVITMNAILGTVQTVKAEKSLDALKKMSTLKARVMRDGNVYEVASDDVTIGDILLLEAGDVVSGDGRVLDSFSLQVNESALTGEAESVEKQVEPISQEVGIADQKNMVFSSSLVTYGRSRVLITGIGMDTQIGKIASLMNATKQRKTPLQRTLDDFSKKLSIGIILICLLVFGLSMMRGEAVLDALMFAVALAVAAIPEALASIVTIVLAIGTQKMAKENAVIKNINAVESLGCVNVICSDKTGTLTQNKMTAIQAYVEDGLCNVNEIVEQREAGRFFLLACALCNDAQASGEQRIGDPTELALIDYLVQYKIDEMQVRKKYPRISENPFDSQRKRMATLHMIDGKRILFVKGACDELLRLSTQIEGKEGKRAIREADKEALLTQNMQFADQGLRVLGFAYRILDKEDVTIEDESDLVFLGLISLMDPPRVESEAAVRDCRKAGIKAIMITGDHKVTARSIASKIGIYEEGDRCMDGAELTALSDDELDAVLTSVSVYARVAPEHKIRIVDAWQRRGAIVSMSGDGVNDAPALKQADIGIAMGITGTEVSKDAASMILLDDNFATIVKAVATGRNIYANIRSAIKYLLSGNLSGIICVLSASLINIPLPFVPVHLLFINLVTDSLPAIAIGMERSSKSVLRDKPRDSKKGILDKGIVLELGFEGLLIAAATMSAYFIGANVSWGIATTMAFSTLCLARLFHGFNCRSNDSIFRIGLFSNKYSIYAFIVGFILLNSILLLPALHGLFSVTTITMEQLFTIYGLAFLPTVVIQFVKHFVRRK